MEFMIPGNPSNPVQAQNQNSESIHSLKFEPPFEEWLYSTCRAILDSKYFEYII